MKSPFYQHIQKNVFPSLKTELKLTTVMALPKITKIVISISHRELLTNKKMGVEIKNDLLAITGQLPVVTLAKKSVAAFKLRAGMPIGYKVTLRRFHMYEFLHRLINVVLPRTRDFRGLSLKSFDRFGNYNFGINEQIIFPEIDYNEITINKGMNITLVLQRNQVKSNLLLLRKIGFPLKKGVN